MGSLDEILITAIVFSGIYYILSLIADYLLKRRLIKSEQYERVGILDTPKPINDRSKQVSIIKMGTCCLNGRIGINTY